MKVICINNKDLKGSYLRNKSMASHVLKLFTVGLIILALMFVWGCRTSKSCGDYYKWESKVKFRSN